MSVVLDPSLWYSILWTYKRLQFKDYAPIIAALSWAFIHTFSEEISQSLGGEPDVWTFVPSTREGVTFENNRLRAALGLVEGMRARLSNTLTYVSGESLAHNTYNPTGYVAGPNSVQGSRVVLIEDTWISGSRAVSAAGALYREGAESVLVLPIARKIDRTCHPDYLEASSASFQLRWPRS